jgi:hypothetical protein
MNSAGDKWVGLATCICVVNTFSNDSSVYYVTSVNRICNHHDDCSIPSFF